MILFGMIFAVLSFGSALFFNRYRESDQKSKDGTKLVYSLIVSYTCMVIAITLMVAATCQFLMRAHG